MKSFSVAVILLALVIAGCGFGRTKIKDLPPFVVADAYDMPVNSGKEGALPAVIRLLVKDENGKPRSMCSATVISNKYAITAAHCIVDDEGWLDKTRIIGLEDGTVLDLEAKPVGVSGQFDYGLLLGDFSAFEKMRVPLDAQELLSMEFPEGLMSCGYPMGGPLLCVKANKIALSQFKIISPIQIFPGMSGGPFFDPLTMTVVGVNSAVGPEASVFGTVLNIFYAFQIPIQRGQ